ncbi:hypothetical protein D3C81_1524660 [compost metagenome]
MSLAQQLRHLLQIIEAAEKRQVIAGTFGELPGDQRHYWLKGRLAVNEPRGDLVDDVHLQLIGVKRRFNVDAHRVCRGAQQIGVIVPGAEGRGKQHGTAGSGQAGTDKPRRHHVA